MKFRWNFPGLRKIGAKIKEVYNKHGLILTILYIFFGVIVLKFGIINGIFWIIDLFVISSILFDFFVALL